VLVIREMLVDAVREALGRAGLPEPADGVALAAPDKPEHGDWSTPVALRLQKEVGRSPRDIAADLARELEAHPPPHLARVEVMGPRFVNLPLAPTWLHDVLRETVAQGPRCGHGHALAGRRINLEFVSANPTGPLHAGGGRWVAVGDAMANLLASQGADVHREYYLNDAGNQLDVFGASLHVRYRGEEPPDDGYQGAYLRGEADRMRPPFATTSRGQAR
jgi:arginyl-tRNA synthetase